MSAVSGPLGVYQCRACGQQLFDAAAQLASQTGGWPNFTRPHTLDAILVEDRASDPRAGHPVRCAACAQLLGQRFDDGGESVAERYCIDWAALRFVAPSSAPTSRPPARLRG